MPDGGGSQSGVILDDWAGLLNSRLLRPTSVLLTLEVLVGLGRPENVQISLRYCWGWRHDSNDAALA
jgi:hypothetical protein